MSPSNGLGERRSDVVEVFEVFRALGVDPEKEAARLMAEFSRVS